MRPLVDGLKRATGTVLIPVLVNDLFRMPATQPRRYGIALWVTCAMTNGSDGGAELATRVPRTMAPTERQYGVFMPVPMSDRFRVRVLWFVLK